MSNLPSVLAISGRKGSGSDWWRGIMPFSYLQRMGLPVAWADNLEQSVGQETAVYDIIVLLRLLFPSAHDAKQYVKTCHRHGKTVIMDLDDDLLVHTAYIESALADHEIEELNTDVPRLRATVRHVDGVTCTNAHLAARVQSATGRPVAIIPNLLDFQWWDLVQSAAVTKPKDDTVTIGWVGGRRNDMDVAEMAPAWAEVARLRPNVRFRIAGHQSDVLMGQIPADRVTTIPWTGVETYPLAYIGIDIGCCPLARSAFNLSKSPIKAVEFAATRVPVVASPVVYTTALSGLDIARTTDDWVGALLSLVDDHDGRIARGQALRDEAYTKWSLQKNWLAIPHGWEQILSARRSAPVPMVLTLDDL